VLKLDKIVGYTLKKNTNLESQILYYKGRGRGGETKEVFFKSLKK
jgi:hypothetical protein